MLICILKYHKIVCAQGLVLVCMSVCVEMNAQSHTGSRHSQLQHWREQPECRSLNSTVRGAEVQGLALSVVPIPHNAVRWTVTGSVHGSEAELLQFTLHWAVACWRCLWHQFSMVVSMELPVKGTGSGTTHGPKAVLEVILRSSINV